jgi:hypothetical protein
VPILLRQKIKVKEKGERERKETQTFLYSWNLLLCTLSKFAVNNITVPFCGKPVCTQYVWSVRLTVDVQESFYWLTGLRLIPAFRPPSKNNCSALLLVLHEYWRLFASANVKNVGAINLHTLAFVASSVITWPHLPYRYPATAAHAMTSRLWLAHSCPESNQSVSAWQHVSWHEELVQVCRPETWDSAQLS